MTDQCAGRVVIEKRLQIMFMSGLSFRHLLYVLSDCRDIWVIPVLTLTSSPILPEQMGLLRKFPFSLITEIHLPNCLGDELCLRLVGIDDGLSMDRHPATLNGRM